MEKASGVMSLRHSALVLTRWATPGSSRVLPGMSMTVTASPFAAAGGAAERYAAGTTPAAGAVAATAVPSGAGAGAAGGGRWASQGCTSGAAAAVRPREVVRWAAM